MASPTERDDELPSDEFSRGVSPPDAPPTAAPPGEPQAATAPPSDAPPTAAPSVEPQPAVALPPAQQAAAAPSVVGLETDAKFDQVMGRIDDLERLVHKVRGVSARAFYATVAALVALAVGASAYVGGQFAVVHDRIDTVLVELRESEARQAAQLRDAEARQIQRVDELARELRAEIRAEVRASEERQNRRVDELAAELRAAIDVLADIQARLVRLETIAGLPPLPVAQPTSAPTDDS